MARLPDTLFIQLDHVLAAPTIQMGVFASSLVRWVVCLCAASNP